MDPRIARLRLKPKNVQTGPVPGSARSRPKSRTAHLGGNSGPPVRARAWDCLVGVEPESVCPGQNPRPPCPGKNFRLPGQGQNSKFQPQSWNLGQPHLGKNSGLLDQDRYSRSPGQGWNPKMRSRGQWIGTKDRMVRPEPGTTRSVPKPRTAWSRPLLETTKSGQSMGQPDRDRNPGPLDLGQNPKLPD